MHHRLFAVSILTGTLVTVLAPTAAAQLSIAPTFVYVDSPERFSSVIVTNNSSSVQEVVVGFTFGYPSADSLGNRFIQYEDAEAAREFNLTPWIRSFPERFRIEPGKRQVVRMLVRPPADLGDAVYWTRMAVTSTEDVAAPAERNAGVSARLDFAVKQVIPIVYRQGRPTTGARISDLQTTWKGNWMEVQALFEREGEVPFFGTATLRVFDGSGTKVEEISTSADVYFASSSYFRLDDLAPGDYSTEVMLKAERADVRKGQLPAMEPVTGRFTFRVPEPALTE